MSSSTSFPRLLERPSFPRYNFNSIQFNRILLFSPSEFPTGNLSYHDSVPRIVFLAYCHDGSVPSQIKLEEDLYILNVDYQAMQKNMSTPNFVPALQFAPSDALSCFSAAIHEARTMLQFFNKITCHFHTIAAQFLFLNEIMKYALFSCR